MTGHPLTKPEPRMTIRVNQKLWIQNANRSELGYGMIGAQLSVTRFDRRKFTEAKEAQKGKH